MDDRVKRILVAADDVALRARLARLLKSAGLEVELASNLERATRLASQRRFAAAMIASASAVPRLAVAALKSTITNIVVLLPNETSLCFEISQEAIVLPSSASDEQLLGRVSELVRPPDPPALSTIRIGKGVVDLESRQFINANGHERPLTIAETTLVGELAKYVGRVRSRHELRQAVVGRGSDSFDRSIDMLIARLRNKLEPDPKRPRFIVTVPRSGYKLVEEAPWIGEISKTIDRRQLTFLSCRVAHWTSF